MKKFLTLFLFLHLALGVCAEVLLTATVDKTTLNLEDELTLTVKLSGVSGNLVMPQLPSLPAFNVYSREVEQTTINRQATLLFRYTMVPRFVGNATIGPVTFNHNGKSYQTAPIEVKIYRSNAPASASQNTSTPSAGPVVIPTLAPTKLSPLEEELTSLAKEQGKQPFFMIAAVSNRHPYVNEEFTLVIRFYYSQTFSSDRYLKPSVSNIFMENKAEDSGSQTINGTLYYYLSQQYTLMGVAPGQAVISSASLAFRVEKPSRDPFDIFFGNFMGGGEEQKVSSAPITLQIRPLPSGQPPSFYGAVGRGYTLKSTAKPDQVEAGEAINWTATVYGLTNLKPTSDLTFPQVDGFKNYPAASNVGKTQTAPVLNYKTFKTVLVPAASGSYILPELEWSYFNPANGKYHTLRTEPEMITVTPSTQETGSVNFAATQPTANGFQTLGQDVRYLKTTYAPSPLWLAHLFQWRALNAVALFLVGVCVLFASFGRKSLAQRKAFLTAKARLKKATAHTDVAEICAGYLQEKFKINTGSLPLRDITKALQAKGVRSATAEAFALLWQRLEAARFAPTQQTDQGTIDLAAQALDVFTLMEEETK